MRPEKECGPCFDRRRRLIDGLNHGVGGLLSRITGIVIAALQQLRSPGDRVWASVGGQLDVLPKTNKFRGRDMRGGLGWADLP